MAFRLSAASPLARVVCAGLMLAACALCAAAETRLVVDDVAPFAYRDGGQLKGVSYELLRALAARVGHSGEIGLVPLARELDMVRREPNTLGTLGRFSEREQDYRWLFKLVDEQVVLLVRADAKLDVSSVDAARHLRVGVIRGGPADELAMRLGFTNIDRAPSSVSNARKLAMGRIDVWLAAWSVASHAQREAGYALTQLRRGAVLQRFGLYLAGSPQFAPAEAQKWNAAFAAMQRDGSYARILKTYDYSLPGPD